MASSSGAHDAPATSLVPPNAFSALLFSDVCELFEAIRGVAQSGSSGSALKHKLLNSFFAHKTSAVVNGARLGSYDVYRLLLPNIDKERSAYMLKEAALARCLGLALGLKKDISPDFIKLEKWRSAGSGDFMQTVYEVVANHRPHSGVLRATVGDINKALDLLSKSKNSDEKVKILRSVVDASDARQVRWLVGIILKDLKLGFGENPILRNYHSDAVDLYNVCCDLRRVCETLHTKSERLKRQDLEPGSLVKAMMASRAKGCDGAFRDMRHSDFIIETKFDGERIQVHRLPAGPGGGGDVFHYFTRNNNDFGPRGYDILDVLFKARLRDTKNKCVLDGELVVWNKRDRVYAPFGYIKTLVKAIREKKGGGEPCVPAADSGGGGGGGKRFGKRRAKNDDGGGDEKENDDDENDDTGADPDDGGDAKTEDVPLRVMDLELVYVAFDVLYDTDHSVIDRPLRDRHEVLKKMFKPVGACDDDVGMDGGVKLGPTGTGRGRIALNVPDQGVFAQERTLNSFELAETDDGANDDHGRKNKQNVNPDCVLGSTLGDVENALWLRIERNEEGVVLKDLDSKWVPGERDKSWIKLKPDYLPTEDLDVIVVGGFRGTGKLRGGKIAEYLLGVVEEVQEKEDEEDDGPKKPKKLPTRVLTFAKVGTGMSAAVMQRLRDKLGPHMVAATSGARKGAPPVYATTGAAGETPDVWIDAPENSVVLTVKADLRLVDTKTFATKHSLRFPRVTGVRWDKPWFECLSDVELDTKVRLDGGMAVAAGHGRGEGGDTQPLPKRQKKGPGVEDISSARLPEHLTVSDTRHVVKESQACSALDVMFIIAGAGISEDAARVCTAVKNRLAEQLKAKGGTHSELRHSGTMHIIATEQAKTSLRYAAAIKEGGVDVMTVAWLEACFAAGKVVDPKPKHRLFLSQTTVDASASGMDQFGNTHGGADVDVEDVMALLSSDRVRDAARARTARTDDDADFQKTLHETLDALAKTRGVDTQTFRGCVFLIILAPDFDDEWNHVLRMRTAAKRLTEVTAGFGVGVGASASADGRHRSASKGHALAIRDIAYDPSVWNVSSPFGEAPRLARALEVSLRLRGAAVHDSTPATEVTHVLVVTPQGETTDAAARFGVDGSRWGVGRDVPWVTPAWMRARIAEGGRVAVS